MPVRDTYPPLNTHFRVEFHNKKFAGDHKFQSVQGLCARLVKDDTHKDPYASFDNIVLKRAFEPDSKLIAWCMDTINNKKFKEENLIIKLLNSKHQLLSAWSIEKAVPVKWGVEELHAQDTKILIETIELKFSFFQVINSKGKVIAPKPKPKNIKSKKD